MLAMKSNSRSSFFAFVFWWQPKKKSNPVKSNFDFHTIILIILIEYMRITFLKNTFLAICCHLLLVVVFFSRCYLGATYWSGLKNRERQEETSENKKQIIKKLIIENKLNVHYKLLHIRYRFEKPIVMWIPLLGGNN